MKKYLLFLLNFIVVSLVLFLLQEPLMFGYETALLLAMSLFTGEILSYYYASSFRLIMLVSLLLATPGIPFKRRALFAVYGICALWMLDLASFFIWTTPPPLEMGSRISQSHIVYSLLWRMLGHWVLPFVLWLLMAKQLLIDWLPNSLSTESGN